MTTTRSMTGMTPSAARWQKIGVNGVFVEREEEVHHRERELDVGISEDSLYHGSVREVVVLDDRCETLAAGAAPFALGLERQHIGQQHSTVAAARQRLRWEGTVIEEANHERSRQPEEFGGLCGTQRDLRGEDCHGVAFRQLTGGGLQDLDHGVRQRHARPVGELQHEPVPVGRGDGLSDPRGCFAFEFAGFDSNRGG